MIKKRLPPLNWLRSFEAAARHLNFTLAAAELNMTQATISQQIKGLESQLGCALEHLRGLCRSVWCVFHGGLVQCRRLHKAEGGRECGEKCCASFWRCWYLHR